MEKGKRAYRYDEAFKREAIALVIVATLPASYSPGVTPGALLSRSHSWCWSAPIPIDLITSRIGRLFQNSGESSIFSNRVRVTPCANIAEPTTSEHRGSTPNEADSACRK